MRRLATVVIAGLALLAACGDDSNGGSSPEGPAPAPPTTADSLVIRVVSGGGLVAPSSRVVEIPGISVYGDGTFVVPGPTTLEYPGAALPNIQQGHLDDDQLAELLAAARDAGLVDDDPPDFGDPGVTDMPSTEITVNADGEEHSVSIYALEYTEGDDQLEPDERAARERVRDFIDSLPTEATEQYDPEAVAVLVRPYADVEGDVPEPGRHDWPLGNLAAAGEPIEAFGSQTRCVVVTDADADTVLATAIDARLGDVWQSAGVDHALNFRPLLPDETGCNDLHPVFVGA